jgi:hypothetical protein
LGFDAGRGFLHAFELRLERLRGGSGLLESDSEPLEHSSKSKSLLLLGSGCFLRPRFMTFKPYSTSVYLRAPCTAVFKCFKA